MQDLIQMTWHMVHTLACGLEEEFKIKLVSMCMDGDAVTLANDAIICLNRVDRSLVHTNSRKVHIAPNHRSELQFITYELVKQCIYVYNHSLFDMLN